ncbi:cytochrome p450 [Rhyzopertha dominica]|nr:cytochrome p450 [Rhyzopertha dominica]
MLWIILSVIVAYLFYKYGYKPTQYWKEKGIAHLEHAWPILGNIGLDMMLIRKPFYDVVIDNYNKFPEERYYGMLQFSRPALVIRDLDLIKQIGVKDFDSFTDHMGLIPVEADPLMGGNLFGMRGQKWRDMRATLSPAFTSSKMRGMFTFMSECAKDFANYFLEEAKGKVMEVDMKDLFTRYTNDVIATSSLGIRCDSLRERESSFYRMGKKLTTFNSLTTGIKMMVATVLPKLLTLTKTGFIAKDCADYFRTIILETIDKRTKENIIRPDMIHLLLEARKGNLKHESKVDEGSGFATVEESDINKAGKTLSVELTDEIIAAQALIFFFAGFETSASIMSFMSLELAINTDVQQKLLEEIDEVYKEYGHNITYDVILRMKYLDQVVCETLRKWTPGFQTDRVCVKDYVIQPTKKNEQPIYLEKGCLILIPTAGLHYDPKYFPNPKKFDPDRFSEENRSSIVPGSYMPFGLGPRNCIGSRFALLEIKVLFYHILSKFELTVVKRTCVPIQLATEFNLLVKGGFWLGLKPRDVNV